MSATPRRQRLELHTPAERAIRAATIAVEEAGADPRLTEAVILLVEAQSKVADFVDRTLDNAEWQRRATEARDEATERFADAQRVPQKLLDTEMGAGPEPRGCTNCCS